MNCLFCRKVRKGTIIVKTSTMWLTRREKDMKEIRQGLSVKERSNVGEQTKRRGGSSWEEMKRRGGPMCKCGRSERGMKSLAAPDCKSSLATHLSPSPLLLHHRPPPRPGRRGGAPAAPPLSHEHHPPHHPSISATPRHPSTTAPLPQLARLTDKGIDTSDPPCDQHLMPLLLFPSPRSCLCSSYLLLPLLSSPLASNCCCSLLSNPPTAC